MVKMILLGIVAVAATLGGAYAGMRFTSHTTAAADTREQEALEFVKLEVASVPVIREAAIVGYVVVRAAFSASSKDVKQSRPALTIFAAEALFKSIYEEEGLNFAALKPIQLGALTERITKAANMRFGRDAIRQLAVESLNYIPQDEVRCQQKL